MSPFVKLMLWIASARAPSGGGGGNLTFGGNALTFGAVPISFGPADDDDTPPVDVVSGLTFSGAPVTFGGAALNF